MKKTLLSMAAIAMVAGAWAQDAAGLIDVTPSYYKYYNINNEQLSSILRSEVSQPVAWNLGSDNWITNNSNGEGENYFSAEQLSNGNILFGSFVFNQAVNNPEVPNNFKNAFSLYDFGGSIGQVLILNGKNSKLNEAIQTACGLDAAPEIPVYQGAFGANFQYNHILDWIKMNQYVLEANPDLTADDLLEQAEDVEITPIRVRVRIEMNAYNNDMSQELSQLSTTYFQNEAGNVIGIEATSQGYVDVTQFSENNVWNPNLWMVREWEFDYTGIAGYIKFLGTNTESDFDNGALLVRSLEVFIVPEGTETYPNVEDKKYSEFYDSLVDYSNVAVEPETLYVIGSNVDGQSWALGTNPMTYANDVYTWTGSKLYTPFKINNGSWDNDDYNIGGTDESLTLGVAYTVAIGAGTGDIKIADYEYVENPTVVYDPKAGTVTVTGTGVVPSSIELYVRGSMNEWGTTCLMTTTDENVFTYSFDTVEAGQAEFKIADANWGTYDFGGDAMNVYSNNPGVQTLVDNGNNIVISNWVGGPMKVIFVLDTKALTVEGSAQPEDANVGISSINDDNSVVEYYNLQGVKVANPQNGIYIIRKGNTTSKAIIR